MRNQLNIKLAEAQLTQLRAHAASLGLSASELARVAIGEYLLDHERSAEMDKYERKGEWGGYTITKAPTGFVVERWSARQGELTGDKYLAPYDVAGTYSRDVDLSSMHNEGVTVGDYIYEMTMTDPDAKVLRKGRILQ